MRWNAWGRKFQQRVQQLRQDVATPQATPPVRQEAVPPREATPPATSLPERPTRAITKHKAHVLTSDQQLLVIKLLAEFWEVDELSRYFAQQTGFTLSPESFQYYRESPKHQGTLLRLREQYLKRLAEIPIVHQRVRMERYEHLYQKTERDPDMTAWRKREAQRAILLAAKQELADNKFIVQHLSVTNISALPTAEVLAKRQQILEQIKAVDVSTQEAVHAEPATSPTGG